MISICGRVRELFHLEVHTLDNPAAPDPASTLCFLPAGCHVHPCIFHRIHTCHFPTASDNDSIKGLIRGLEATILPPHAQDVCGAATQVQGQRDGGRCRAPGRECKSLERGESVCAAYWRFMVPTSQVLGGGGIEGYGTCPFVCRRDNETRILSIARNSISDDLCCHRTLLCTGCLHETFCNPSFPWSLLSLVLLSIQFFNFPVLATTLACHA